MRILMLATAAAIAFAAPVMAQPPLGSPTFSAPPTEQFLRDLDNQQLRMVRNASRGCPSNNLGVNSVKKERDPCVIASTDRAVAASNNPDLQAFHEALPPSARYDEQRPSTVWLGWAVRP
ncbi:MAG: hypothetical protein SGI91_05450 [Alphaproteobacteria bacterium]|jgi:hypothetical protein|nr:hypothetical protein [Alphaproteobacteria bacterium]